MNPLRWRPVWYRPWLIPACFVLLAVVLIFFLGEMEEHAGNPPPARAQEAVPSDAVTGLCLAIERQLHSVPFDRCAAAGLRDSGHVSVEGRPLVFAEPLARAPSSAPPKRGKRPIKVLLIGGIHGDELVSVSAVFHWVSRIRTDDEGFLWRVIPLANPDGLLAGPRRTNARGVDLNRNFASADWTSRALQFWATNTKSDPRRNPGQGPSSEPETQWLETQVAGFAPDVIVSVHAPYGVLDFDGPNDPPQKFGSLRLNRLGIYPGSLGNYAGLDRGIPVVTLEFPRAGTMPAQAELSKVWSDMVVWIRLNVPGRPERIESRKGSKDGLGGGLAVVRGG